MNEKALGFEKLLKILDRLREECPWDRKQTIDSLRNNTIEECFELSDAIVSKDWDNIREELGDMLLHIAFYSKIAEEQQKFSITEVCDGICNKLIRRHPHVFGEVEVKNAEEVTKNWEAIKLEEKGSKKGTLSGVPGGLPAMIKAMRVGEKAAGAGFDWKKREDVWEKVREELGEFEEEVKHGSKEDKEGEFGDILFALINMARLYDIDAEAALERTNRKFIKRFNHIEDVAASNGRKLSEMTLAEMDEIWNNAKKSE